MYFWTIAFVVIYCVSISNFPDIDSNGHNNTKIHSQGSRLIHFIPLKTSVAEPALIPSLTCIKKKIRNYAGKVEDVETLNYECLPNKDNALIKPEKHLSKPLEIT